MSVNTETQRSKFSLELIKWITVFVLIVVAISINYIYCNNMIPALRLLATAFLIFITGCIVLSTTKGKKVIIFVREARIELKKVIWPTRQETLHTTLIVAAITAIMSLILWGLDSILVRLVSLITSLRF